MPSLPNVKAQLARLFLNFLEEHGDYKRQLEQTAARAARASASRLLDEFQRQPLIDEVPTMPKDPYDQIQLYLRTIRQCAHAHAHKQMRVLRGRLHDELHHELRVPALNVLLLLAVAWRTAKTPARLSVRPAVGNMAEQAAWAAMKPHSRTMYISCCHMYRTTHLMGHLCLILAALASLTVVLLYLITQMRMVQSDAPDTGTLDNYNAITTVMDRYWNTDCWLMEWRLPIKQSLLIHKANYTILRWESMLDTTANPINFIDTRRKIFLFLVQTLAISPSLASYLTHLPSLTLAHLSSLTFLLFFLLIHPVSKKIYAMAVQYHPMRHFFPITHTHPRNHHSTIPSDEPLSSHSAPHSKVTESDAQRKRRERMLQQERYKAQMAQLAMEAKLKVEERRKRIEGLEEEKKEKEEEEKKDKEESDETVKMHSRQFMMLKAGVPEGAILNSFFAEGIEDEAEAKEILDKLRNIKAKRAEEARKAEEEEEMKRKKEEEEDKEKERLVSERLRLMKQGGAGLITDRGKKGNLPGFSPCQLPLIRKATNSSIVSAGSVSVSSTLQSIQTNLKPKIVGEIESWRKTAASPSVTAEEENMREEQSSSTIETASISVVTTASSKSQELVSTTMTDKTVSSTAKGKMLADISKFKSISLSKTSKITTDSSAKVISSKDFNNSVSIQESSMMIKKSIITLPVKSKTAFEDEKETCVENCVSVLSKSEVYATKPAILMKQVSELTTVSDIRDLDNSPPSHLSPIISPPLTTNTSDSNMRDMNNSPPIFFDRVLSPILTTKTAVSDKKDLESLSTTLLNQIPSPPITTNFLSQDMLQPIQPTLFDAPSIWACRPTALDIQAQIEAVEAEEEELDEEEEIPEHHPQNLYLGFNAFHSPAFDMAVRNSNASWDRRPSARDIMAKIMEAEQAEIQTMAAIEENKQHDPPVQDQSNNNNNHEEAVKNNETCKKSHLSKSSDVRRKGKANGDDDSEISELSMPTYEDQTLESAFRSRSIPQALFLRADAANIPFSPATTSSPGFGFLHSSGRNLATEKTQRVICMVERGELSLPPIPDMESSKQLNSLVEEETLTNELTPVPDMESSKQLNIFVEEETLTNGLTPVPSSNDTELNDTDVDCHPIKVDARSISSKNESVNTGMRAESEDEKLRRERAVKRAKKLEEMAARRNTGNEKDDDTAVSGISKHHRLRRKRSALASIAPEEKERTDWIKSLYSNVLHAEKTQWQRSIFHHIMNAEKTQQSNISAKHAIQKMDENAQRIKENQRNLEKRAKKFAAKAERFHKLRKECVDDDDCSVMTSTSRMRRRLRKSAVKPLTEVRDQCVPSLIGLTKDDDRSSLWCKEVYKNVLSADANRWKKIVFLQVITAEEKRVVRLASEALVMAADARVEKDRQNELRAKKMSKIQHDRRHMFTGEENISPQEWQPPNSGDSNSMKKMRDRRRRAALAKKAPL